MKTESIMSLDEYSTIVFSKDYKEIDDMWNMPTYFIMQESLKSHTTLCILSSLHETFKNSKKIDYFSVSKNDVQSVTKHKVYFADSDYKIPIIDFYSFPYCIVEEHCPKIFGKLRAYEKLDLQDMLKSLHPQNNQMTLLSMHQEHGGSGSLFIFTEDHKLVLKLITNKERKTLIKELLYSYYEHIENHPSSLLNRLLGVFTIRIPGLSPLNILLSPSLVDDSVDKFFDLKGSTYNRLSIKSNLRTFKGPYKDSDFINEREKFFLESTTRTQILKSIKLDAKFLLENGIMDYSLIVCILNEKAESEFFNPILKNWYRIGIIDFLGQYSLKRKAEYYVKLLRLRRRISMCSVMNPRSYYHRFVRFLAEKVFIASN